MYGAVHCVRVPSIALLDSGTAYVRTRVTKCIHLPKITKWEDKRAGADLELCDGLLHVGGSVLAEIDEADVAQLVPIVHHGRGVHRRQLQLLPLQPHLPSTISQCQATA